MCLWWMPSKVEPSASSARRERSFAASVFHSTRRQPQVSNACSQLQVLRLDVRAGVPGVRVEPRPADLDRPVLGAKSEEPRRPDRLSFWLIVTEGNLGPSRRRRAPGRGSACHSARVCGCTTLSQRQVRGIAGCEPQPFLVLGSKWLEPDDPPLERRCVPLGHGVRQYTRRSCRSTSTRAWSASRTSRSSCARVTRR